MPSSDASFKATVQAHAQNRLRDARALYERLISEDAYFVDCASNLSALHFQENNFAEADG